MKYRKWIFLVLALVLIYAANNMICFKINKIEPPTCRHCQVEITGERCSSCNKQITLVGVFQYDGQQIHFGDRFDSYEDYKNYMMRGKIFNIVGIPMMLIGIVLLIYFFYCVYRDSRKMSQIV